MPETRDVRSLIEAAEQAASAGDYATAGGLLREAATRQEETLGAQHPDLVNTLNNLGVVCEMTDNPIDAEHFFRRAHTVATATLPPDHPFVETSRKNLHDFCAARGRPVELPPSPPQVVAPVEAPAPRAVQPHEPAPPKRSLLPLALATLGGIVLLIVILTMGRPGSTPAGETGAPATAESTRAPEAPDTTPTPPAREPVAQPQPTAAPAPPVRSQNDAPAATPAAPAAPVATPAAPVARSTAPATPSEPAAVPTVVTAQLCTALTAWRCEPAASQASPGALIFYTQLKSPTAITIEHRWYQGDRLRQAVQLPIQANPDAGYRTYSRHTISGERAGEWRVELRTADGTVLREERFTVR